MAKSFELNENEEKLLNKFCEKHRHPETKKGAIGGHISVTFAMTSLGEMPSVRCGVCGEKQDITDYDKL